MQICAVTVAYNNPKELARLLRSLQIHPNLNGLIVLDNSREEYLKENEAIFRMYADRYQFTHLAHPKKNIGSAGAFCQGMKIAHEKEFDWVWLLDQDGTAEKGCLASLLRNAAQADILCPQIVNIDNPEMVLPLSLIHISEPTRRTPISYAVFCLKKKKKKKQKHKKVPKNIDTQRQRKHTTKI